MIIESISIAGRNHRLNEDRFRIWDSGSLGTSVVVADGMGGLSFGDTAAFIVTDSVTQYLREHYRGTDEKDILLNALSYADGQMKQFTRMIGSKMGAAIAAAIVTNEKLFGVWQGNVRIYVQEKGRNVFVTGDHIADIGYGRTALTRCIKGERLREGIPFFAFNLKSKDNTVIICTDGMYEPFESQIGSTPMSDFKKMLISAEDDATLVRIKL